MKKGKETPQLKFTKIAPLENLSLVDKVEIRLIEFFRENKLVPGNAIPSELEFSESLGVSRTVVREAFLRLRTLGLIESKKHRGMILTQPDPIDNFERVLDPRFLGSETLGNLFELRLALEMGLADFLFFHKTKQDLDELEKIVALEEATEGDQTRFSLEKEIAFHGKLYEMSRNVMLQRFSDLLLPIFEYVIEKQSKGGPEYSYSEGQFITHRNLLDNLRVGTPETFRNAMRKHLEPHFDNVWS